MGLGFGIYGFRGLGPLGFRAFRSLGPLGFRLQEAETPNEGLWGLGLRAWPADTGWFQPHRGLPASKPHVTIHLRTRQEGTALATWLFLKDGAKDPKEVRHILEVGHGYRTLSTKVDCRLHWDPAAKRPGARGRCSGSTN